MSDQNSPQANADVTEEGIKLGEEYDRGRQERTDALANDSKELEENRSLRTGTVVTGAPVTGTVTLFPGAAQRGLAEDATSGGVTARAAKGLDTGDVTADDSTWTAQSAQAYVADNAADVPGQTFTVDQLPDPAVVAVSGLPEHTIPEGLVVGDVVTDDINPTQEAGGDVGTAPRHAETPAATGEAEASVPAEVADGTSDAKRGGRAAGRKNRGGEE